MVLGSPFWRNFKSEITGLRRPPYHREHKHQYPNKCRVLHPGLHPPDSVSRHHQHARTTAVLQGAQYVFHTLFADLCWPLPDVRYCPPKELSMSLTGPVCRLPGSVDRVIISRLGDATNSYISNRHSDESFRHDRDVSRSIPPCPDAKTTLGWSCYYSAVPYSSTNLSQARLLLFSRKQKSFPVTKALNLCVLASKDHVS